MSHLALIVASPASTGTILLVLLAIAAAALVGGVLLAFLLPKPPRPTPPQLPASSNRKASRNVARSVSQGGETR